MSLFRNFVSVGSLTLLSRLAGFVRDALMAAVLGTGPAVDAFFAAFRTTFLPAFLADLAFLATFFAVFLAAFLTALAAGLDGTTTADILAVTASDSLVATGAGLADGAAGGTGFGLLAWGARLVPGAQAVAQLIDLPARLAAASLVITGEGSFDASSAAGKTVAYVQELAAAQRVPVALVAGRVADSAATTGFASTLSLTDLAGSAPAALGDPARWLQIAGRELAERFG